MNARPYWHLAWKEYRAIRAFWLALVAMIALAEWLAVTINHSPSAVTWVFNLALAAPAFFAVGAAGIAFAIEREEGTVDFLRAVPVSAKQVLVAKLGMASVATLAMYLLVWPMALHFTGGRLPESTPFAGSMQLGDMLGLWIIAAVEAIAWGTLFSLMTARPLLAICQGIFAVSTITHLLAGTLLLGFAFAVESLHVSTIEHLFNGWSGTAVYGPCRILIALVVFAVDVYLGLRWLHRDSRAARFKLPIARRRPVETNIPSATATGGTLKKMLAKPDRGAMFGHLMWQHWRQSRWLMLSLAAMWVTVSLAIGLQFQFAWSPEADHILTGTVIVGAALLGCCVFRPDQERRYYRFFVEHNVPPRYVWLTRQLPWIAATLIAMLVICVMRMGPANIKQFWQFLEFHFGPQSYDGRRFMGITAGPEVDVPQLGIFLGYATVSYAAGQWTSMLIRSGIIAAVAGVVLSVLLCGWVLLMDAMHVSWLWSVAPIPLALIGATWLRSPDWIGENRRWSARGRAAAAVLLPAIALLAAVPIFRVHQIPFVSPGFDVDQSLLSSDDARATADLYRRASDLYVPLGISDYRPPVEEQ
jgi:ABC-type transport system involved in multi-copper enzyme maturation permease subunit